MKSITKRKERRNGRRKQSNRVILGQSYSYSYGYLWISSGICLGGDSGGFAGCCVAGWVVELGGSAGLGCGSGEPDSGVGWQQIRQVPYLSPAGPSCISPIAWRLSTPDEHAPPDTPSARPTCPSCSGRRGRCIPLSERWLCVGCLFLFRIGKVGKANVCQRKEKSLMVLQKSISRRCSACVFVCARVIVSVDSSCWLGHTMTLKLHATQYVRKKKTGGKYWIGLTEDGFWLKS